MNTFNKEFVLEMLIKEKEFKVGDAVEFIKPSSSGVIWTYTMIKESEDYLPYMFLLRGISSKCSCVGTYAQRIRRYTNLDQLFTDLLNNCNDNVAIKNRYNNTKQYLFE